jgi:drug/metabolite transporter (DMT)-like permease
MGDQAKAMAPAGRATPVRHWWYGAMGLGGLAFGLIGDRRPFGTDVLAHPLSVFFILIGAALLFLRIAAKRPVPELIPDRALLIGCIIGLVAFLAGNFVAIHWLPVR